MNPLLPSAFALLILLSYATSETIPQQFIQCFSAISTNISGVSRVIFVPTDSSYISILESRIQNLRFNTTETPKPLAIVTPLDVSHVQATILCARKHNLQIRIRSGGHDFEGLSYVSPLPFVVLDLINLRNVTIDVDNRVAWVESGATLGELYYRIVEKTRTLAFPAGVCPTVGVGGHFSGGGQGILLRKFGLAADNIVDAILVDVDGRVLVRASMGEDLFWAIRGGGGNSFGVVISWKLNLVPVPPTVTFFRVTKSLEQNATQILNRWQYILNKLPDELIISTVFSNVNSTRVAMFPSVYLGEIDSLLPLMEEKFPELGVKREDCNETSWIEALLSFGGYTNTPLEVLLNRTNTIIGTFKDKSDYVKEPMPEAALEGLVKWFSDDKIKNSMFSMVPYGGKMGEIAETSIPFPHRAGNLYMIDYEVKWDEQDRKTAQKHINWLRKVYSYMTPYVSKNPREAYLNCRDLDIGTNNLSGNISYRRATIWGTKYFRNNFERLVRAKTNIDPHNFFRNEQSIPSLS